MIADRTRIALQANGCMWLLIALVLALIALVAIGLIGGLALLASLLR